MYKGMISIFLTENGPLTFETKKIEPCNKRDCMKAVKDVINEATKNEKLFNIQVTIQKV